MSTVIDPPQEFDQQPAERRRPAYVPMCPVHGPMSPYKSFPLVTYYHCLKCERTGKAPRVSFNGGTNRGNAASSESA